ncbi:multidrug effflux MFS transporter [Photobacterium kagoshimensis]|uniref:multidrug effflux MFS transporter n=1 Tax=Photobacterium kagoshimensis TaxID=2910242 RepID=UPI003D0F537F
MTRKPSTWLMVLLMMFPQIIETIYSPVLPHIATTFSVAQTTAAQTLSVYFIAFALGVLCWGILADVIGRRYAMLLGLVTYGIGAGLAIIAPNFEVLLGARIVSAFGAAVGSVVAQTMLRDSYQGSDLAKLFSIMGAGIALSPVIGLLSGGWLATLGGHVLVFSCLLALALILLTLTVIYLPETQPQQVVSSQELSQHLSLLKVAKIMLVDQRLWLNSVLIALFNIMLFSYYSLAPFAFQRLGLSSVDFGYSGIVLAAGCFIGSILNKRLHAKKIAADQLVFIASVAALVGGCGVWLLQDSIGFLLPMMLVVISFGIAIPNILSQALVNYKQVAGTAGALFGLSYYLLLGLGLALSGWWQHLGSVLCLASVIACWLSYRLR